MFPFIGTQECGQPGEFSLRRLHEVISYKHKCAEDLSNWPRPSHQQGNTPRE